MDEPVFVPKDGKPVLEEDKDLENKPLTPKQELFALAFTGEAKFNATEAAKIAGYEGIDVVLRNMGHENLTKPYIMKRIAELTEQRFKDAGFSVDRTIKELLDIAFHNPADFFEVDGDGYVKLKADWKELPTAAIKSISCTTKKYIKSEDCESWVTRIEFQSKEWAVEMLSKLLNMKSGDNTINIKVIYGFDSTSQAATPKTITLHQLAGKAESDSGR